MMKLEEYKVGMVVRLKRDTDIVSFFGTKTYRKGELGIVTAIDRGDPNGEACPFWAISILWKSDLKDIGRLMEKGTGWIDRHHGDDQIRMADPGLECVGRALALDLGDIEPAIDLLPV